MTTWGKTNGGGERRAVKVSRSWGPHDEDADLVRGAQAGDHAAAELLLSRYVGYLRLTAIRASSSPSDAEEAVAAARLIIWEKLSTLRDPDRFATWAGAIVRNHALRERRRRVREIACAEPPEVSFEDRDLGEEECRMARLERAQRAALVLSTRDRVALERVLVQGRSAADLAAELHISDNAVYQLLHRARRRLRRAYLTPQVPADAPLMCRKCAEMTPDYIQGDANAREVIRRHCAKCEDCHARLVAAVSEAQEMRVFHDKVSVREQILPRLTTKGSSHPQASAATSARPQYTTAKTAVTVPG